MRLGTFRPIVAAIGLATLVFAPGCEVVDGPSLDGWTEDTYNNSDGQTPADVSAELPSDAGGLGDTAVGDSNACTDQIESDVPYSDTPWSDTPWTDTPYDVYNDYGPYDAPPQDTPWTDSWTDSWNDTWNDTWTDVYYPDTSYDVPEVTVYCWENKQCGDDGYCYFSNCGLESGHCEDRPISCPYLWEPVCGCDGVTYANACLAAQGGMSVDYAGECKTVTNCYLDSHCDKGFYCYFKDCAIETGACTEIPDAGTCPRLWAPVCSCTGISYNNLCFLQVAQEDLAHEGECYTPKCETDDDCGKSKFCLFTTCDDDTGSCEDMPTLCPDIWAPVCGCDGITYDNECSAYLARMSVALGGACEETCASNDECEMSYYCAKDSCEGEDGSCEKMPTACSGFYYPVCGCDGKDYDNNCIAASYGVNVAYVGLCDDDTCWSNDDCGKSQFCYFKGCAAETGTCTTYPSVCWPLLAPVCGCDGKTYQNECTLMLAGQSLDHEGDCI